MYILAMSPTPHTSFRLSPEAKKLLAGIAKANGLTQTAVLEMLIRKEARRARR
jgi:predicted DNA-binding protein